MRLITLGDSWVKGIGSAYEKGMTKDQYFNTRQDDRNSFRIHLSNDLGATNFDLSQGGSSNQKQFRRALKTFFGKEKIVPGTNDLVLWGITSVYRTELWSNKNQAYEDIFLPQGPDTDNSAVSKILSLNHHDEAKELEMLGHQIQLWNAYFKSIGLKNYWFNIFNDHVWDFQNDNFLFDSISLLSCLIEDRTPNDHYHKSDWNDVDRKINRAKDMDLVNSYTGHPNRSGHRKLADLFKDELTKKERIVN